MIAEADDCQDEIIHNNQILASGDYLSSSTIVSEAIIAANSTVNYQAATFIDFLPNFHAEAGSFFSTNIEDCNPQQNQSYLPTISQQTKSSSQTTTTLTVQPNPFSGTTLIQYELSQTSPISLDLYSLTGKKLKSIYQKEMELSGMHQQTLDLNDFPKGLYFVVLQNKGGVFTKKIVYQ